MKKLLTLIAGVAVAGSASAALIASQDFDGGGTGTAAWSYGANLSTANGYAETTTAGLHAGDSKATLNSTIPAGGGSVSETWLSYRFTMAAHGFNQGGDKNSTGFIREWSGGPGDRIGFWSDGTPDWGSYHPYVTLNQNGLPSIRYVDSSVSIPYNQDVDLLVVGLFKYHSNGTGDFYMTTVDYANGASLTEANVLSGFSVLGAATPGNGGLEALVFNIQQGDAGTSTPTTLDNLLVGTTYADIAAIPEPATFGLVGIGALMAMAVRRMRM